MQSIKFVKMSGAGNDFVLIDNRECNYLIDWIKLAPKICDRRYGVGADGLIVIEKSIRADFKMNYFNSDGSFGGMCGNGGRCSALFAMESLSSTSIMFEALDYIYHAELLSEHKIKLKMKPPKSLRLKLNLNLYNQNISYNFIDTGAPHVVIFTDDLPVELQSQIDELGIINIGKLIRNHEHFSPEGTNVDFVRIIDKENISIRTYEKGVENETLACGTGAVASAIITTIQKNLISPINVHTRSKEILKISFDKKVDEINKVELIGSAKKIFEGDYSMPDNICYVKLFY